MKKMSKYDRIYDMVRRVPYGRVTTYGRIARFYYAESCGQCTPCREGTGWMYRLLQRLLAGDAGPEHIVDLVDIADRIEGRTICAFGDAAAWPVQSFLKHFRPEFEAMARANADPVAGGIAA